MEFIQLARQYQPLNLGQGFPDDLVPEFVLECLKDVTSEDNPMVHQYARAFVIFCVICDWFNNYNYIGTPKACFSPFLLLFKAAEYRTQYWPFQWSYCHKWSLWCPAHSNHGSCKPRRWGHHYWALFWLLWTHGQDCRRNSSLHSTNCKYWRFNHCIHVIHDPHSLPHHLVIMEAQEIGN